MGQEPDKRSGTRGATPGDGGADAREGKLTRTPERSRSWLATAGEELAYQDLERDERVFVQQAAELRQAIADSRVQIESSLVDLRQDADDIKARATDALDVRRWAREHPWRVVGVAAAVGFYFGFRE